MCEEMLRELGLLSLEKAQRDLINVCKCLLGGMRKRRRIWILPSVRTRGYGHRLNHRDLHSSVINFLWREDGQTLDTLPWRPQVLHPWRCSEPSWTRS